jgi:hypothetical protein
MSATGVDSSTLPVNGEGVYGISGHVTGAVSGGVTVVYAQRKLWFDGESHYSGSESPGLS